MTTFVRWGMPALMLFAGLALIAGGCGQPAGSSSDNPVTKAPQGDTQKKVEPGTPGGTVKDDHSGWWCTQHGIPEHECSMCDEDYAKKCKDAKDWCDEHDRAKSQCFKCDPSLKEKFAAKYVAKYGKAPPPIGEERKKQ